MPWVPVGLVVLNPVNKLQLDAEMVPALDTVHCDTEPLLPAVLLKFEIKTEDVGEDTEVETPMGL